MDNGASSYRRFLEGDEAAFDEIWKAYRDNLTFFINRFVRDYDAAEDIAIDTFVMLYVHKHRYNFKTSLKTYLFMIGRSRALDYIRRRDRIKFIELSEHQPAEVHNLPENAVIAGETKQSLNKALEELPEEMRTAVYLVYFERLSYEEAAVVMKKSRKQIDNLLYRAKAQLRSLMGKDGEL